MEEGHPRSKFKRLCVFCGSNSGNREVFSDAAIQLGNELVSFLTTLFHSPILFHSSIVSPNKIGFLYGLTLRERPLHLLFTLLIYSVLYTYCSTFKFVSFVKNHFFCLLRRYVVCKCVMCSA